MSDAVQVERLQLRSVDDVSDRDLLGTLRQNVSTAGATSTCDDSSPAQAKENLLDVVSGEPFLSRYLPAVYRAELGTLGEVQSADDSVLSPGRYPHAFRIEIRALIVNPTKRHHACRREHRSPSFSEGRALRRSLWEAKPSRASRDRE